MTDGDDDDINNRYDSYMIKRTIIIYTEFVKDLDAVSEYAYRKTSKSPALLGISMGTIIVNEYLRIADIPVSKVVFDGYVADPKSWKSKLAANGKTVSLPTGYRNRKY